MPAAPRGDKQAPPIARMIGDEEVAAGRVGVPADARVREGAVGQARHHLAQRAPARRLALRRDAQAGVVQRRARQAHDDGVAAARAGGVLLRVRHGDRVGVAVAVAGDLEEAAVRRHGEQAGAHVQLDGRAGQGGLLRRRQRDVRQHLARRAGDAAQVEQRRRPRAGRDDRQLRRQRRPAVQLRAPHRRRAVVDQQPRHAAGDEGDAAQRAHARVQVAHAGLGVGPARRRVQVAGGADGAAGAAGAHDVVPAAQDLDGLRGGAAARAPLLRAQRLHVRQALGHVRFAAGFGGQAEPALVVAPGGAPFAVAPERLRGAGEGGVGRVGVVGADDAVGVDLGGVSELASRLFPLPGTGAGGTGVVGGEGVLWRGDIHLRRLVQGTSGGLRR